MKSTYIVQLVFFCLVFPRQNKFRNANMSLTFIRTEGGGGRTQIKFKKLFISPVFANGVLALEKHKL